MAGQRCPRTAGPQGWAALNVLRAVVVRSSTILFIFWLMANTAIVAFAPPGVLSSNGVMLLALRGYTTLWILLFVERHRMALGAWTWAAFLAGFLLVDSVTWWLRWHDGFFPARTLVLSSLAAWVLAAGARFASRPRPRSSRRISAGWFVLGGGVVSAWAFFSGALLGPNRIDHVIMRAHAMLSEGEEDAIARARVLRETPDWTYWRALVKDSSSLDAASLVRAATGPVSAAQRARLLWLGFQVFPDTFEPMLALGLDTAEVPLRLVAVQMLGLYRHDRYAGRLRAATEDSSPHVALAACEALALRASSAKERDDYIERRRQILIARSAFDVPPGYVAPLGVHDIHVRIARRKLAEIHAQVRGETIPDQPAPCLYSLDGAPFRQGRFRLRGLTDAHMHENDRSFKLILDRADPTGWRSLNMNSLRSDSDLEDLMTSRIYGLAGVPYYRVGLARLTINDRYAGLRYLVENHDEAFQVVWGLSKGNLYREEVGVNFNVYHWDDPSYFQRAWKNKARNADTSMLDLVNAHRVLNTVPDDMFPEYARLVWDEEGMLRWYATTALLGTLHQNIHNIMWYSNANTGRIRQFPMDVYFFDMAPNINVAPSPLFARWLQDPEWNHRKNLLVRDLLVRMRDAGFLEEEYRAELRRVEAELNREASLFPDRHGYFVLRPQEEILAGYRSLWRDHAAYLDSALRVAPSLALARHGDELVLQAASAVRFRLVEVVPDGGETVPMVVAYRPRLGASMVSSFRNIFAALPAFRPLVQDIPLHGVRARSGATVRVTVENEVLECYETVELVAP